MLMVLLRNTSLVQSSRRMVSRKTEARIGGPNPARVAVNVNVLDLKSSSLPTGGVPLMRTPVPANVLPWKSMMNFLGAMPLIVIVVPTSKVEVLTVALSVTARLNRKARSDTVQVVHVTVAAVVIKVAPGNAALIQSCEKHCGANINNNTSIPVTFNWFILPCAPVTDDKKFSFSPKLYFVTKKFVQISENEEGDALTVKVPNLPPKIGIV